MVRVLLADDHEIFLSALAQLVEAEVGAAVWMTKEDAISRLPEELACAARSEV